MHAGIDFQVQHLGKADAVEFSTDFAIFIQPLRQRFALNGDVNHLHIVEF